MSVFDARTCKMFHFLLLQWYRKMRECIQEAPMVVENVTPSDDNREFTFAFDSASTDRLPKEHVYDVSFTSTSMSVEAQPRSSAPFETRVWRERRLSYLMWTFVRRSRHYPSQVVNRTTPRGRPMPQERWWPKNGTPSIACNSTYHVIKGFDGGP